MDLRAIWILFTLFLLGLFCNAQPFQKKRCYFKVDFKLNDQQLYTDKIVCFTKETNLLDEYKTELRTGDMITDSSIVLTRYFVIGKKRKLKNYNSVHVIIQLVAANGDVIQKIDGEILKSDWECH